METLDLATVPREDLEIFVADSMRRMDGLEQNLQSLEEYLKIDPEVIGQWREWLATVDGERERWMETATRLSDELQEEKQENSRLFQVIKDLTVTLERVHDKARRNTLDIKNARVLDMRNALLEIRKHTEAAMIESYDGVLGWPDEVDASSPPQLETSANED